MRGRSVRLATTATLLCAVACGGRLLPITGEHQDGGSSNAADSGVDGDDADDGSSGCNADAGPAPLPACAGDLSMCLPPDSGVNWTGAAVIKCQPTQYCPSVTLVLERLIGTTWYFAQRKDLYSGTLPATFDDMPTGQQTVLTYRVCVEDQNGADRCGKALAVMGAPDCACLPATCKLQTACNTTVDDGCGDMLKCGACANGIPCNPDNNSCCPMGFMSDEWGGCVCAPPPKGCGRGEEWDTSDCSCHSRMTPLPR
jgi:hypothetical protein